mmetsp:Transcript_51437/g.116397  ORF Transcript_51437/g.116397 Transcript_51437/m.116397 type:complete len:103 (-) Transcript_51437:243-551(-)
MTWNLGVDALDGMLPLDLAVPSAYLGGEPSLSRSGTLSEVEQLPRGQGRAAATGGVCTSRLSLTALWTCSLYMDLQDLLVLLVFAETGEKLSADASLTRGTG